MQTQTKGPVVAYLLTPCSFCAGETYNGGDACEECRGSGVSQVVAQHYDPHHGTDGEDVTYTPPKFEEDREEDYYGRRLALVFVLGVPQWVTEAE